MDIAELIALLALLISGVRLLIEVYRLGRDMAKDKQNEDTDTKK